MLSALLALPWALLVLAITISTLKHGPFGRTEVSSGQTTSVVEANRALAQRNWLTVGVGLVTLAVMLIIGSIYAPLDSDRTLALAPLTAAISSIIVVAIRPLSSIRESNESRSADIIQRKLWHFAPLWMIAATALIFGGSITIFVLLGNMADADGMSFSRRTARSEKSWDPFPGFFYAVPIIAAIVVLGIVVALALARITNAPRPTSPPLADADSATRFHAIKLALKIGVGAVAYTSGIWLVHAGGGSRHIGEGIPDFMDPDLSLLALGKMLLIAGWVSQLVGIAFVVWAGRDALKNPVAAEVPKLQK